MAGMATITPSQTRPGGRSARVRAAVHHAVEELLAEGPSEALTIPIVAARAGVHPTTVYRRWGSLAELLGAVASSRFSGDIVVPDTGSLRGDLERWVTDVATDLEDPEVLAIMRAAVGAGTEGGCMCVADRHAQLDAMLERERSRAAGRVGGDGAGAHVAAADAGAEDVAGAAEALTIERVADALLGPLYYRAIFTSHPAPPDWARELVGALLG
jgi:AcrR family transcriptional regulator